MAKNNIIFTGIDKWKNNINSFAHDGKTGDCPFCGSNDTEYRIVPVTEEYGYADIWCNNCNKAVHISRVMITKEHSKK